MKQKETKEIQLIIDALRTMGSKAYDTYTGPASTLTVWAEFGRLADIIEHKLAEREADKIRRAV